MTNTSFRPRRALCSELSQTASDNTLPNSSLRRCPYVSRRQKSEPPSSQTHMKRHIVDLEKKDTNSSSIGTSLVATLLLKARTPEQVPRIFAAVFCLAMPCDKQGMPGDTRGLSLSDPVVPSSRRRPHRHRTPEELAFAIAEGWCFPARSRTPFKSKLSNILSGTFLFLYISSRLARIQSHPFCGNGGWFPSMLTNKLIISSESRFLKR